jgi:hypothetical protein
MTARVAAEVALLVDVGSAWTKASIVGRTQGRWRVMAHAAQPTAWGEEELRRTLVDRLSASVDPRLVGELPALVASANRIQAHTARRPGRMAVVAVSRELSGSSARRAAESAGWEVVETVTLDDGRSLADRLATLQSADVDAWLLAGGFDAGRSQRALEAAALVASARRRGSAPVVWAGSERLGEEVAELFEPGATTVVANPRPDARREELPPLSERLLAILRATLVGEDETQLSTVSLPRAVGALAAGGGMRILAVDVGARAALRAFSGADGRPMSRVHARGGLAGLVGWQGAAARVARLAGNGGDETAVADLLQTLRARPATVPQTVEEVSATQAAAIVALGAMLDEGPPSGLDLLVGCGRTIAAAPEPWHSARMLLDGVRPLGVTQLAVDVAGVLGPLGSLGDEEIGEGLGLLGDDLLVPLGSSVVTRGGEPGRTAMRVTVHRPGWPSTQPIEVRGGQLQVVPLPRGHEAELHIELGDGVTLGAARRTSRVAARVTGGTVGLVLDARGVPIALPRRADDRRAMVTAWREAFARQAPSGVERIA